MESSELDPWDEEECERFRVGGVGDDDDVVEDTFEVELLYLALFPIVLERVERRFFFGCSIFPAPASGTGIVSEIFYRNEVWCGVAVCEPKSVCCFAVK